MATRSKKSKKTKLQISKIAGYGLISLGVLVIVSVLILTRQPDLSLDNKSIQFETRLNEQINYPIEINFPSQNKQLSVAMGSFQYGTWKISENSATFLDYSGIPGESGNVVIYGHKKDTVFGDLSKVRPGDKVEIKTINGQSFSYSINSVKDVWPNQVEVLEQGSEQKLTLFTCTGIFDSKRLVVSATRSEAI